MWWQIRERLIGSILMHARYSVWRSSESSATNQEPMQRPCTLNASAGQQLSGLGRQEAFNFSELEISEVPSLFFPLTNTV